MKKAFLPLLLVAAAFGNATAQESVLAPDTIMCIHNGFVNQGNQALTLWNSQSNWNFELKAQPNYVREAFINFPLDKISNDGNEITLCIYLVGEKLAAKQSDGTLNPNSYTSDDLGEEGIGITVYDVVGWTYDNTTTWATRPSSDNDVLVATSKATNELKDQFIKFDVTKYVKEQKVAGKSDLVFRFVLNATKVGDVWPSLRFRQIKEYIRDGETRVDSGSYYPRLIQLYSGSSAIEAIESAAGLKVYPAVATDVLHIEGANAVSVYNACGACVFNGAVADGILSVAHLSNGVYFVKGGNSVIRFIKK